MNVQNNKVLDVSGNKDREGQNVHVWNRHNGPNQRWNVVYLDKMGKDLGKGALNKWFGFYVNRPFYIMSKLPMRRVIEVVGGRNLVIKRLVRNRNTQKFVFDQATKTIKSVYNRRSIDIQNSGRSSNLQVWTTNSRWF